MSESNAGQPAPTPPAQDDTLKNLKSEFDRKLSNIEAQAQALAKANQDMAAKLAQAMRPPVKEESEEDLLYRDPAAYAKNLEAKVKKNVYDDLAQASASQARQNSILAELHGQFPELADNTSELTKKAVEIYSSMDVNDKANPMSYKLAVKEAAMDLGMKPKSKRSVDDEPTAGGGDGYSSARKANKMTKKVNELANIFGIDTNNPEVKARMAARIKRQTSEE